jgi:hypothetical protein
MLFFSTLIGISMLTLFPYFIFRLVRLQVPEFVEAELVEEQTN